MRTTLVICLVAAFAVCANAQSADPKQAPSGHYTLETRHSEVLFAILHQGLTYYHGRFDRLSGTLDFDSAEPEKSTVSITIDMTSVDVPSQALIGTLAGDTFFDAAKFPTTTFKSTSIVRTGPMTGKITGDLTIKNVTKPVTLDADFTGSRPDAMSGGYALGFHAAATIKRTDFALTGMRWEPFVGDDVTLIIEAPFLQQKD